MDLPFNLPERSNVLVAGAGGGFDVYCALPVALKLKELGHEVHLASYSFTNLEAVHGATTDVPHLSCISTGSVLKTGDYFPESFLCKWWLQSFSEEKCVWSYSRVGVRPLANIFCYLKDRLKLNAIIVLDGGVDGLFIGNEFDLATPSMDAISIIAASTIPDVIKMYAFTAFGTEGAECSVRHADALLRISELSAQSKFVGVTALTKQSDIGKAFIRAVEFANSRLPADKHSVIAGSIVEAIKGRFGFCAFNAKTQANPVWISPLTAFYWFVDLEAVAKAKPYFQEVLDTSTVKDVADAIDGARRKLGVLPRTDIPI